MIGKSCGGGQAVTVKLYLIIGKSYCFEVGVYFSYIVVVSFIGKGKQSTHRKALTCRKSLTNFITVASH
jgi:hypothetical protein